MQRLLSVEEAATYMGVPKSFIYRLSHEGRLPGRVSLGHRTLKIDKERLDRFIERKLGDGGEDGN